MFGLKTRFLSIETSAVDITSINVTQGVGGCVLHHLLGVDVGGALGHLLSSLVLRVVAVIILRDLQPPALAALVLTRLVLHLLWSWSVFPQFVLDHSLNWRPPAGNKHELSVRSGLNISPLLSVC